MTKDIVLRYKPVPLVEHDVDGKKTLVPDPDHVPVADLTVTLRELNALDAMDAEDIAFALAGRNGLEPGRTRIIASYGLCAVTAIDGVAVPPAHGVDDYRDLALRLGRAAVDRLTGEYITFAGEAAAANNPKASPGESPSVP